MSALGSRPSSPPDRLPGRRPAVPAVVWGRVEETRLLLRGLLRLHRFAVVLEASTRDDLAGIPAGSDPRILVVDAEGGEADWPQDLAVALRERPELVAVVVLPRGVPAAEGRARFPGARAVVARPFAIHDLVAALDQAAEEPPSPPSSPVPSVPPR